LAAIDPGVSGAIASRMWGETIKVQKMPEGLREIYETLDKLVNSFGNNGRTTKVLLERVGFHRPGNSAVASCTFARHCGALEMALVTLSVPYVLVTPQKWMAELFGKGNLPSDKAKRKEFIYQKMVERHPEVAGLFKYGADAVAMLEYLIKLEGEGNADGI
jgi:hypothetical protein